MNEHFKDQLLLAILCDIDANPRADIRPTRVRRTTLLAATVVLALVAGGLALFRLDRPHHALVVTDSSTTTSTLDPALERGFVFTNPHGTTYRVLGSPMGDAESNPPSIPKGTVTFRLAGADARVAPMAVTPLSGPSSTTHVVEVIGGREIGTPDGLTMPPGMTDATNTGPWMFTESDGTKWMAMGLLTDLRRALPDLSYTNGAMVLGSSLVAVPPPSTTMPKEILRIRDQRFEFGVSDDRTSTFDFVDPRLGQLELVDIGGHQGVLSTGESISWRVDANTVITVQRSLASNGPQPTVDELIAASRSIRPATATEIKAIPVWRGAVVERVIVMIPPDLPVKVRMGAGWTGLNVVVEDLDDPTGPLGGFSGDETWSEYGLAIPLDADRIGHRLRLTLQPAVPRGGPPPAGQRGCPAEVTVPGEDEAPVTVHLQADC